MLRKFFNNSKGYWESHRNYYYAKSNKIIGSITYFNWKEEKDNLYTVEWNNQTMNSKGSMSVEIVNDFKLKRTKGYFTEKGTESEIIRNSNTYLKTLTYYNNYCFDEVIEFITPNLRSRKTIAYSKNKDGVYKEIFLVGSYLEKRIDE